MDGLLTVAWGPVLTGDRSGDAHALLSRTVTSLTGVAAADQVLARRCGACGGPHGGPVLLHPRLFVSLSSTASVVAVAVTGAGPVGVDVESCASAWETGLGTGTAVERARAWTRVEAAVKARGTGLTGEPALDGLQLYDVPVPAGLVCTAAVLCASRPVLHVNAPAGRGTRATGAAPAPPPARRASGARPC